MTRKDELLARAQDELPSSSSQSNLPPGMFDAQQQAELGINPDGTPKTDIQKIDEERERIERERSYEEKVKDKESL